MLLVLELDYANVVIKCSAHHDHVFLLHRVTVTCEVHMLACGKVSQLQSLLVRSSRQVITNGFGTELEGVPKRRVLRVPNALLKKAPKQRPQSTQLNPSEALVKAQVSLLFSFGAGKPLYRGCDKQFLHQGLSLRVLRLLQSEPTLVRIEAGDVVFA